MKKLLLFLMFSGFLLLWCKDANAGAGFYENPTSEIIAAIFNFGATNESHRLVTIQSTGNYGSKSSGDVWLLKGLEATTWEDGGDNVSSVTLNYRIYKQGTSPGSFSQVSTSSKASVSGNNYRFSDASSSIDLFANVSSSGTWEMEFYMEASSTVGTLYFSNSGSNYKLYFNATSALPVSLINFSAFLTPQNQAQLSWSTASELNASHFNVHRSDNGVDKQEIGIVAAQGNSNEIVAYNFVDAQPVSGQAFYFLEQVDFDGKTEWFGPVKVSNTVNNQAGAVFGVNNDIVITLNGGLEMDRLEANLFDMQGKLIKSVEFSGDQLSKTVNFSNVDLPSGMYMLYLQSDKMEQAIKLAK